MANLKDLAVGTPVSWTVGGYHRHSGFTFPKNTVMYGHVQGFENIYNHVGFAPVRVVVRGWINEREYLFTLDPFTEVNLL